MEDIELPEAEGNSTFAAHAFLRALLLVNPPGVRAVSPEPDEVYLYFEPAVYKGRTVIDLAVLVGTYAPDEVSWDTDHLRLWWD